MTFFRQKSFRIVSFLLALACVVSVQMPQPALAAPQGSPPNGGRVIEAGHIPTACTEADAPYSPTGATYGYYWSEKSEAWIASPYCHARWGLMHASPSQIITAGSTVTATVLYDDSRMAGYMAIFGGISWDYPGTLVSGCGTKDVTCTVKLGDAKNPPKEWAWYEFHISGPGRVFILPPSYAPRCQPETPCLDTATNAWTYVGVAPSCAQAVRIGKASALAVCKLPMTISGRVSTSTGEPLADRTVVARKGRNKVSTTTDGDGNYSMEVKKGDYDVAVTDEPNFVIKQRVACQVKPCSKKVKLRKKSKQNVNFKSFPVPIVVSWTGITGPFSTSSGELYDDQSLTVSSPLLALGTMLRLKVKGRTVLVRVNDRGPYETVKGKVVPHRARQSNVTTAVMDALGLDKFQLAHVTAEVIPLEGG